LNTRHFIRQTPYLAWVMLYCAVTAGMFGVMLGLVTPNLRAQWQLSYQDMGLLMTLSSAGGVVGSLLGGHIAKRFGARRLFLAYAGFTLTMLVGLANAPTFGVLVACFALTAVTESALFTLGHGVLANMSTDSETRTRFIGLVDVGFSLGTLVAPLWVAGWFAVDPAWRGKGLAQGMIAHALDHCHALNRCREMPPPMRVGTQLGNAASLRLYGGLGFRQTSASYVLHLHKKGV